MNSTTEVAPIASNGTPSPNIESIHYCDSANNLHMFVLSFALPVQLLVTLLITKMLRRHHPRVYNDFFTLVLTVSVALCFEGMVEVCDLLSHYLGWIRSTLFVDFVEFVRQFTELQTTLGTLTVLIYALQYTRHGEQVKTIWREKHTKTAVMATLLLSFMLAIPLGVHFATYYSPTGKYNVSPEFAITDDYRSLMIGFGLCVAVMTVIGVALVSISSARHSLTVRINTGDTEFGETSIVALSLVIGGWCAGTHLVLELYNALHILIWSDASLHSTWCTLLYGSMTMRYITFPIVMYLFANDVCIEMKKLKDRLSTNKWALCCGDTGREDTQAFVRLDVHDGTEVWDANMEDVAGQPYRHTVQA